MQRRTFVLSGAAVFAAALTRNLGAQEAPMDTPLDIVVTRTFPVPPAEVWRAWSEPELVKRWWGPAGFTCPFAQMDLREGGVSLVAMRDPAGNDMYSTWAYTRVTPHEYFEYIFNLADAEGNKLDPVALGFPPDFPVDARHDVRFRPLENGGTEMVMTEYGYTNRELYEISKAGLEQCLDKMAAIFAA